MRSTSTSKNTAKRNRTRTRSLVAIAAPLVVTGAAAVVSATFHAPGAAAIARPARLSVATIDWPTFGGSAARAGSLPGDRSITPKNVRGLSRRWVATFARGADTAPIVLAHVPGRRVGDPLVVETDTGGTTYALDGASGAIVWRFATSGPKITTSVAVAGSGERILYVPAVDGRVHALDAASGREISAPGFPLAITRMPDVEKNASALSLANGYLYAVTGGYIGDAGPYDGHVVAVRLADGSTRVTNSLCSSIHGLLLDRGYDARSAASCPQQRSGIWSRAGAVVDPDPSQHGRVYAATGNGAFDAGTGGSDYGDSLIALRSDASGIVASFTPRDYAALESDDADLGSTAPAMLPRENRSDTPLLAVQGGKGARLYLLDRERLGGVGGERQALALPAQLFSAPAVWRDGSRTWVYAGFADADAGLRAFTVETDAARRTRLRPAWSANVAATSPVVVDGVVFVAGDGALRALDARSGRPLWSSAESGAGGSIGGIHWQSPVAVDGWVYCSDQSRHLTAYAVRDPR